VTSTTHGTPPLAGGSLPSTPLTAGPEPAGTTDRRPPARRPDRPRHRQPAGEVFADRHIGPRGDDVARMLATLGLPDLEALAKAVVPGAIRQTEDLALPPAASERRSWPSSARWRPATRSRRR
jgi:glycine dehydrogenase